MKKMEVAEKMEVDKEEVSVKVEIKDEPDVIMDTISEVKEKVEENLKRDLDKTALEEKGLKKEADLKVEVVQKDGQAYLKVEGVEDDEDEDVIMSPEEIHDYLQQKVMEGIKDPKINPLIASNKRILDLQEDITDKNEEFNKLNKLFELINRNQEKFLRSIGILPKVPTATMAVMVDLPALPNSVPPIANRPQESLLKRELSVAKATTSSVTKPVQTSSVTKPVQTSSSSLPQASNISKDSPLAFSQKSKPKPADSIECIDLTDDIDPPKTTPLTSATTKILGLSSMIKHPAPLPPKPFTVPNKALLPVPPKPRLKISAEERGIVLQWDMPPSIPPAASYAELSAFDIFGYQEQKNIAINTLLWKKIGSVNAMTLPMACTLTQFVEGNKYHFSIRAVDIHNRCGSYSDPISIVYKQSKS